MRSNTIELIFSTWDIFKRLAAFRSIKPAFVECGHETNPKYKLAIKDKATGVIHYRKICDACAKAELDNNRVVFVRLF